MTTILVAFRLPIECVESLDSDVVSGLYQNRTDAVTEILRKNYRISKIPRKKRGDARQ